MTPNKLRLRWLLLMAWRDSRRNRSRLLLFISSIILGIGALVAVFSLGDNLQHDIDAQAAELIGADLSISTSKPIAPAVQPLLDSLGNQRSSEESFASMIFFPKSSGTRLVQVKALQGNFPYYGALETQPVAAGQSFRNRQAALVDKTLMLQFGARVGDTIRVGRLPFVIEGTLLKAPGQTGLSSSVAPAVYIPLRFLSQTGLAQKGSRITYRYYYQYEKDVNVEKLVDTLKPRLEQEGLDYNTVASQKENTGQAFGDITNFLSLVGFIALLLGCIGVASAIHIYIREKIASIAILRCLGVTAKQAFLIFLLQIVGIGAIGSMAGAALGTGIQQFLPVVLADLLPVTISTAISWAAIGEGVLLGICISLLFALLPLISLRKISPLNTLRVSYEPAGKRDAAKWLIYGFIVLFILGFSYLQLHEWVPALFFTVGIVAAFLLLSGMATLLIWAVRRFFPAGWSYLWRQGLSNLFRPNNQTVILIVSIGLGTTFICILFSVQSLLLNRISLSSSGNQPNMVLFDIQPAQTKQVTALVKRNGLPVLQQVPIINMRLERVNQQSAASLSGKDSGYLRGAFTREFRVTYRDSLSQSEKVTAGTYTGRVNPANGNIYVSVEDGYAKRQHWQLGDTMVFNVQGVTDLYTYRQLPAG